MSDQSKSSKDPKNTAKIEDAVVIESSESPTKSTAKKTPEKAPEKTDKKAKTGALWFFTIVNLLVLIVICIAAYWYYMQLDQNKSSETSAITSLSETISQVTSRQNKLQTDVLSKLEQLDNNQNSISESVSSLNEQSANNASANEGMAKRLAELSGRRPSDWLLAEANYLVNMAGRKLYLEKDTRTAMTLLQEADARLVDLNDPSLLPVRALLASDIQALNQINPVSSTSIAMSIAGLIPQVANLPINSLKLPETEKQADLTLSEDVNDWQSNLQKTWRSIVGDFISIKKIDAPLEPYLAERQQWLIEQQIMHALTQAQTAVLNEEQALFSSAIQQAIAGLNEHYNLDDASVNDFIAALQTLQSTDFTKNMPSELKSQASLKDIIEQRIQSLFNNRAPQQSEEGDNTEGDDL